MRDWKLEVSRRLTDPALAARTDIVEEMAQHLEQRYRTLRTRGYPEERAYEEALQELTDSAALVRELRKTMPTPSTEVPVLGGESSEGLHGGRRLFGSVIQDLRYAMRMLIKNPE